jgi:hypothetical protein
LEVSIDNSITARPFLLSLGFGLVALLLFRVLLFINFDLKGGDYLVLVAHLGLSSYQIALETLDLALT